MVSIYVTQSRVANKEVNDRFSSKYCLFSRKGRWTFCQMFRCGVSKHRALPASSRVILSYYSLQMICLCRTTHKTWFHAATIAGFSACVPEGESWGYCTLWWQNGAKVACHFIFNVLPPTSSDFIIYAYYIYFSNISPSHWCSTDFHQMGEVYTTQKSVSRKRTWYITDTTNWCYNGYWVFPGDKADGRSVDHPHPSRAEVTKVELHIYPLSGHSWPVLGWTLPFSLSLMFPQELRKVWRALTVQYTYIHIHYSDIHAN